MIASVTQPFCGGCTRARLSAEGELYTCLFATAGTTCGRCVRGGESDDELRGTIAASGRAAATATRSCAPPRPPARPKVEMSHIGG